MPELRASLVLDANAQDLDREVRRATRIVDRFGREVRSSAGAQRDSARSTERQSAALRRYARRAHQAARSTRGLDLATQRLDTGLGRLAPLAAGAGLALLGRAAIGTIQSFESLRATLETFSDSQRQAADRWEVLSRYARRTPFELEDVVRAYGVLVSRGLEPTQEQIETLAEIAAGSSRTYVQFAEAVADAVQGETERLKEFGIQLSLDGERARLSFRRTHLDVARSGEAILGALETIARKEFGGAVERQARTLGGAPSTLRGNLSEVSDAVGRGGLAAELNELARGWAETADGTRDTAREFGALAGLAVRHADTIGLVAGGYVAYRLNLALATRAQVFYARALGDSSRGLRGYLGLLRRASRHTGGFAVVARSAARAVGQFAAVGIALGLVAWAVQAAAAREETRRWREELDETARSLRTLGRGALEARAERTRGELEKTQASIGRRETIGVVSSGLRDPELERLRFEEHRLELANAAAALALARRRQRQTEEDLEAARARPDRNAAEIAAIEAELARHERETAIAAGQRARERFRLRGVYNNRDTEIRRHPLPRLRARRSGRTRLLRTGAPRARGRVRSRRPELHRHLRLGRGFHEHAPRDPPGVGRRPLAEGSRGRCTRGRRGAALARRSRAALPHRRARRSRCAAAHAPRDGRDRRAARRSTRAARPGLVALGGGGASRARPHPARGRGGGHHRRDPRPARLDPGSGGDRGGIASAFGAVGAFIGGLTIPQAIGLAVTGFGLVSRALRPDAPNTGVVGGISPTLQGIGNTAHRSQVVPEVFGSHRVFPPAIGWYTEPGSDWIRILLAVGMGPVEMSAIHVGETPIGDLDGAEIEVRNGETTDAPLRGFSDNIIQSVPNIRYPMGIVDDPTEGVAVSDWSSATTAPDTERIGVGLHFPAGMYTFKKSGGTSIMWVRFDLEYRVHGTADWQPVPPLPRGLPQLPDSGSYRLPGTLA